MSTETETKIAPAMKADQNLGRRGALEPRPGPESAVGDRPVIAVFSRDQSIVNLIAESMSGSWLVERYSDAHEARAVLLRPCVKIVVVDDESVEESTRGWLLGQVRKCAPHALTAYVAALHSPETERRARGHRIQYYTSKPLDRKRTAKVLQSFESALR